MLQAEFLGVQAIANTKTLKCPQPIACGVYEPTNTAFLIMEYLEFCSAGGSHYDLGQQLAQMHRSSSCENPQAFGFGVDNTIGATPQPNLPMRDNWADFWVEHRLNHMLELTTRNARENETTIQKLRETTRRLLSHDPCPSLLHGDLWGGNKGFCEDDETGSIVPHAALANIRFKCRYNLDTSKTLRKESYEFTKIMVGTTSEKDMPWAWIKAVNEVVTTAPWEPEEGRLPVRLLSWLWLSDLSNVVRNAKGLCQVTITHVLSTNVMYAHKMRHLKSRLECVGIFQHCFVMGRDEEDYDMVGNHWEECRALLPQVPESGGQVVVHCAAGTNHRSGLIACAAVMLFERRSVLETVHPVR